MRFFKGQAQARRYTLWLVWLYVAALSLTVAALTWVLGLFLREGAGVLQYGLIAAAWSALMLGASAWRLRELSGGGEVVAEALEGARLYAPASAAERRLMNVVEEMALAAMMPVPKVYLLPDGSINAFAAGTTPANAVIGVTRGALQQLDRAQLQAVVAHEFSHIANGDMRLNMRLTGWLFGLQLITVCARWLMFGTDLLDYRQKGRLKPRRDTSANEAEAAVAGCMVSLPLTFLGGLLMLIGGLGNVLAGWIQAAICRQREFLADASAVQFTRQTEGMVGALHKIAVLPRQRLHSWHAAEYAHFMFGSIHEPDIFDKLAATHPATIERIRRLSPFRARQLADEIGHVAAGGMQYEGWLGFAQVRREASWADAEAEALENEHEARAAAMRRRIEAFRPGAAARSAAWQRTAPRAWRSAAGDGERLPLLAGLMLAGEAGVPEALGQQWLLRNPLRQDTLARLVQHMPAPADYIDTLDEMLPQAAADEMLAELWQDADAAFTANEQPTLMQACVWLLLRVYAGAKNAEGQGGGVQGDATEIAAFTAEVLAAPLQTASVRLSQQCWQNIQTALNDAAALPEPERRRILADCIQIAEASPDLLRAQTWLYTLRVAWDLPSEAV